MNRRGLPLSALMGIVLALGAGMAGLRHASARWGAVASLATVAILLFAVLAAWKARRRSFWQGFVLFGGGPLILAQWAGPEPQGQLGLYAAVETLLDPLFPVLHAAPPMIEVPAPPAVGAPAPAPYAPSPGMPPPPIPPSSPVQLVISTTSEEYGAFHWIGFLVVLLAFATAGGVAAHVLDARRLGPDAPPD